MLNCLRWYDITNIHSWHPNLYLYIFLKQVRFPPKFLVWSVLCYWQVGLSPSSMQVRPALHPRLDHVDPYKLTHGQLYVSVTYTNSVRSNTRAYLPSYFYNNGFWERFIKWHCSLAIQNFMILWLNDMWGSGPACEWDILSQILNCSWICVSYPEFPHCNWY